MIIEDPIEIFYLELKIKIPSKNAIENEVSTMTVRSARNNNPETSNLTQLLGLEIR